MNVEVSNGDRITIVQDSGLGIYLDLTVECDDLLLWDRDIRDELATNDNCPSPLQNGWWQRRPDQITGLTFHHTLSHSPWAFTERYIHKGGGRPSIPYTIWVTETGEILSCLALEEGCWHNHHGHRNRELSVGLAGTLHIHHPSNAQLDAAARVAAWAVRHEEMRITLRTVGGHMDIGTYEGRTECPGWASAKSGHWREKFYNMIRENLSL